MSDQIIKYQIGEKVKGFVVERIVPLGELQAVMYQMSHEKTGLQLLWLDREEENKTFAIGFPTIPEDDTGVFHILEHSLLSGSDRYPVKEPFVELLKTSMNTFLNAMTFPDKTIYPVCSRNDKDFTNLVRVYLDAVFHPLITSRREIFLQEGWHYEFAEDGESSYKGVVFNEMKGAFANADRLEAMAIDRALYPDSPYRFVSGGDPARIPDLTYEKYLETYYRFYSPANAFIFLDGSMNPEEILTIIDGEYLQELEAGEKIAVPDLQKPVDGGMTEISYEIPEEEAKEPRTRFAWAGMVGTFRDADKMLALRALTDVLCCNNQSPLARVILEKGLAEDVTFSINDSTLQTSAIIEVLNFEEENLPEIQRLLCEELKRQAAGELDREQVRASLVNMEFQARERDFGSYPSGLMMGISMLSVWMYGADPETDAEIGDRFARLRALVDTGYYEQLLKECILENPHACRILMHPSTGLGQEKLEAERRRLQSEMVSMSMEEKEQLQKVQERLTVWQNTPDRAEDLAKLPKLKLEDISAKPEPIPTRELQLGDTTCLVHELNCNGIVYLRLYLDLGRVTEEELSALNFATCLLGDLPTRRHSVAELENGKRLLCGFMDFAVDSFEPSAEERSCVCKLSVNLSALESKAAEALELALEILTETVFENEEDIRDILRQEKMEIFQGIIMSGASIAIGRIAAQMSAIGVADECVAGMTWYQWLKQKDENWNFAALTAQMQELLQRAYHREGMVFTITGEQAPELFRELLDRIPANGKRPEEAGLRPLGTRREGIIIPAEIAFAVRGGDLAACGGRYGGRLQLAQKIVSLNYLWNEIRVKGGAYGSGMVSRRDGMNACYSYRDPNGSHSLEIYPQAGAYLRRFADAAPDLTGYIIGTIGDYSPLRTNRMKGRTADQQYFQNITWEERCRVREELIEAKPSDLSALADCLEKTQEKGGICVIGGRNQIEKCAVDEIITL